MKRDDSDKDFRKDKRRYAKQQPKQPQTKKKKYKLKESDVFGKAQQESIKNLQKDMAETLKKVEQTQKRYGEYKQTSHNSSFKMKEQPRDSRYQQPRRERQGRNPRNENYRRPEQTQERDWKSNRRGKGRGGERQRGGHRPNYVERGGDNQDHNKNQCFKYMKDSYILEKDSYGLDDKIKKLRKLFKEQFKDAHNIRVYASKNYPMIYFQYMENQKSQDPTQLHLRQVFKKVNTLRDKRSLFEDIFERVFSKVPNKFHKLAIFAIQKAKSIKVSLNKESIFNLQEGSDVMFYYTKGKKGKQKYINFTLFDRGLRSFQFNSNFIEDFEEKHPEQFESYHKFQNQVFEEQKQGYGVDVLLNEELSSDEQDKLNFQERTLPQLREAVYKIANKNTSDLDQIIEKKYDEMIVQAQRDTTSEKFKRMHEEHQDLTQNRDNFDNTRNAVVQRIQKNKEDKRFLKICLKKLIIAEKQLESRLPIVTKKRKIFQMLRKQSLLIIEGQTGSGKSTQLPQMLCEYYDLFQNHEARPVLVTQPRKLATRTLAQRVAKQMGEDVGGFVDYVASAGRKASKQAKIIFKLDRLVLDQITQDNLLQKYSCLVIDQAHQRTISIDVILGLVKELLKKRKDFKVIVTSASMDTHLFETYFGTKTLKVSGRTFPVTITYKNYQKYKEGDKYQMVYKIRKVIDDQILHDSSSMKSEFKGHVLCFCSSVDEITELVKIYGQKLNRRVFDVFALHGKVTPADQKKAFEDTGKHKIIFSSRIAETAITIDGVRVVIDPGQDIELVFDQKYKVSSMKLQDITQSSAKQRAGRSGRTGPGHCFRLYSQQNFKSRKPNKIPEIKNSSLQTVVLRLKTLKIHDVITFPYVERPDTQGLRRSVELLILIGALNPKSERVTKIGELLIKLPIQPFLSRAIIEAFMFDKVLKSPSFKANMKFMPMAQLNLALDRGVKSTVIEILSMIINFSNLFFIKKDDRQKGESAKYSDFSDQQGDFFFLDNIFRKYKQFKSKNEGKLANKGYNSELNKWIREKFLNFKALCQINDLVEEIAKIIQDYTIDDKQFEEELDNVKIKLRQCKSYRQVILSSLITSFSANLCKFSGSQQVGYTIVNQRRPIQIYGTSNLSLLGIKSDWIICYDLYTSQEGRFYCKLAHKVDYAFMNKHIDRYIWKKFDIEAIQKNNPFYTELTCDLPTKYIQQIKFDFNKCDTDQQLEFLRGLFPSIAEQTNKVSFFLQNAQKNNIEEDKKVEAKRVQLNKYLAKIHSENKKTFRHNYIGNIFINLTNGFSINSIQFSNKQFLVQIIAPNNQIVDMIEIDSKAWGQVIIEDIHVDNSKNDRRGYGYRSIVQAIQKKKIKVYIIEQQNKKAFISYLALLNQNLPEYKLQFKESLVDKRRKIPQTKILLHYFAGTCQKNNLLISYATYRKDDEQEEESMAEKQLQLIKSALYKKKERGQHSKLTPHSMHVTRNKNGINVSRCDYDEYQINEQLFEMDKANLLTFKFKFPSYIKKFRQPQISQACKNNEQWKNQIVVLLQKINIKPQNVIINIHGFYKPDKKKGEVVTAFDRSLRVDMNATLTTLDTTVYKKLKDNYDGKNKIIGCEKTHVRVVYEQIITVCPERTFMALEEEFRHFVQDYKVRFPLMRIESIFIKTRNKNKIMIKAISSKREDFIEPQRVINKLFSPKLIKLQASQFKFINHMDEGNRILQKIQDQYDLKIYFGMSKINHSLKVYCEDADLKDIEAKIKEEIKKFKFYSEDISYRGKNLKKVKEVLQALKADLKKGQMLTYEIIFQYRKVQLTADLVTFEKVKNQILKLSNSDKKECLICTDIMRNPYRFINCNCTFCWLCITDHVRAYRNNINEEILTCPNDQCKQPISVFDVRTLLTEEQFQKICDIKISKFIQKNGDKYIACKYCENFFDKKEVQQAGVIECQICGKSECLKCKDYHPNYSCEDWKNRDNIKSQLKGLGVKQCPSCGTGIQKSGGCNHMQCSSCHTHICWKCLKTFTTSKLCYDHLAKQCGGIFDNP